MDGAGDVTLTGGITSGANLDEIVLSADGEGTKDFGAITATAQADLGEVTFTGASDIVVDDIVDNMTTNSTTQKTVNFNGDGDAAIADMNITVDDTTTYTINSESTDGTGENVVATAVNIAFGDGVGGPDASTLEITGNQDLTLGTIGTAGTYLGLGADDGDTDTLDASAFTGALTVGLARDTTAGTSEEQTVKLGTGDAEITIDDDSDAATDDFFTFVVGEDGITGDVQITNFALDHATFSEDNIDFTALTETVGATTYDNSTGVVAINGGSDTVTFAVEDYDNDGNDDLVGTSSLFDGEVVILGSADLALDDIAASNFA
jgi:hypothetical protein